MNSSVKDYMRSLLSAHDVSQSELARELGLSRQEINYYLSGTREIPLEASLRLESFFGLAEGTIAVMQAKCRVKRFKDEVRASLVDAIRHSVALWSYADKDTAILSDEDVIENTFLHLDMHEIDKLFVLYPRKKVMDVWKERLALRGDNLRDLNIMIAMYYFGIRRPEEYLKRLESRYINKMLNAYA